MNLFMIWSSIYRSWLICATITYEKKKKKNSKLWNVKIEASKKKSNL